MTFDSWFQTLHPTIHLHSAQAVLRLTEEGGTVPFIARYRKEQTGNLDEVAIQQVIDARSRWDETIKRQTFIIEEIERQGKLTDDLKGRILTTFNLDSLEDLYLPYKTKRKTKATVAREAGLEPLAEWVWALGHGAAIAGPGQTLETFALAFYNPDAKIVDAATAIQGAQDILVERLSETPALREYTRRQMFDLGSVRTIRGAKAKPHSKFDRYFSHCESIRSLLRPENSHRYLAMRRGWMEEELSLGLGGALTATGESGTLEPDPAFDAGLLARFESEAFAVPPDAPSVEGAVRDLLLRAAKFALRVFVAPAIESEIHRALKDAADAAAIKVFAENLRKLLVAAPLGAKAVLGVDPGIRTGCKLAVVDDAGKYIASTVMHTQSEGEKARSRKLLTDTVAASNIRAIAVGNGTAGRETETFIRETLRDAGMANVPVVMVNESGASIYSASETAREEFPGLDLTVRGAISIARRLQDPLAELVKVDPKSIGVGQYQHDVSQPALKKELDFVVDSCVNSVGVNLNTASYHLLERVAGIGPSLAKKIVDHRNTAGLFSSRTQLLDISRFSRKAFEQAAGFLRIPNAAHPLDNTGVHPERYAQLEGLAARLGKAVGELTGSGVALVKQDRAFQREIGEFTFADIVQELSKPGRDPRSEFQAFSYREDVHAVADLKAGMVCPGIVTNVTNFGAFVDIGVHQDGLVHISQLSDRFVKDPREVVNPGDRVSVRVLEVNLEKRQIALTMKSAAPQPRSTPAAPTRTPGNRLREERKPAPKPFNNPFTEQLSRWKKS
ncbi:MAG TPA: Tex family protein [Terriglobia bacterium]|nr:Tex family protein [Terriglobia bacterium]